MQTSNLSFIGVTKNPDFMRTKSLYDHNLRAFRKHILEEISRVQNLQEESLVAATEHL